MNGTIALIAVFIFGLCLGRFIIKDNKHVKPGANFRKPTKDEEIFTIEVLMKKRWIPHFLAMLKYMQSLGGLGGSRMVSFYADGDGDFRPQFNWDEKLPSEADPVKDEDGDKFYDAG